MYSDLLFCYKVINNEYDTRLLSIIHFEANGNNKKKLK